MAEFICPKCAQKQTAPDAYIGRTARCLRCDTKGTITDTVEPAPVNIPDLPAEEEVDETPSPEGAPLAITRTHARLIIALLAAIWATQLVAFARTKAPPTATEIGVYTALAIGSEFKKAKKEPVDWEYRLE